MKSHAWGDTNKELSTGNDVGLESSPVVRALMTLMDKSEYHCSNKGKHICRGINSTEREVTIPTYSVLVMLHLE